MITDPSSALAALDSLESIAINPWLRASLTLTLLFLLPGAAWSWMLLPPGETSSHPARRWIMRTGAAIMIGVPVTLLLRWIFLEIGFHATLLTWVAWALVVAVGIAAGLRRGRSTCMRAMAESAPGFLLVWVLFAIAMLLPQRGEWILGGWDPGVYVNEGLCVAREQSFTLEPQPVYEALTADEFNLFTRGKKGYRECFPGVPIDPDSRTLMHYFFRLTPTAIATTAAAGGLRAAARINEFIGILTALAFCSMLSWGRLKGDHVLWSAVFLLTSPIWIYHLHTPTTELLHLLLLCNMGACMTRRHMTPVGRVVLPLNMVALLVNRLTFAVFAGLLIIVIAWLDRSRTDRKRVCAERAFQVAALAVGIFIDLTVSSATITRIYDVAAKIPYVAAGCVAGAVIIDLAATWFKPARHFIVPRPLRLFLSLSVFSFLLLAFFAGDFLSSVDVVDKVHDSLSALVPYFGWALFFVAMIGIVLFIGNRRGAHAHGEVIGLVCVLASAGCLFLYDSFVFNIYPWATRRHLCYSLPVLVIGAGYAMSLLWRTPRFGRPAAILATVLIIGIHAHQGVLAWSNTEYDGASDVLARVDQLLDEADVVVTDHPWWGTPLTFIYGHQVLNGKELWQGKDAETMQAGLVALNRLHALGYRIRLVTSTDKGTDIYPNGIPYATQVGDMIPFAYKEILHHKKARSYEMRERVSTFSVYSYEPEQPD